MRIAILSLKGGAGKSTLACHLVAHLVERGARVHAFDCDPQQQAAFRWLSAAFSHVPVDVLTSADEILDSATSTPQEQARQVVYDGKGGLSEDGRALALVADLAIIPTQTSVFDLQALAATWRLIQQVQRIRSGLPRAVAVLSRVVRGTRLALEAEDAVRDLGVPLARSVIHQRQVVA